MPESENERGFAMPKQLSWPVVLSIVGILSSGVGALGHAAIANSVSQTQQDDKITSLEIRVEKLEAIEEKNTESRIKVETKLEDIHNQNERMSIDIEEIKKSLRAH